VKIPVPMGAHGSRQARSRLENGVHDPEEARDSGNFVAMMQFVDWLWFF